VEYEKLRGLSTGAYYSEKKHDAIFPDEPIRQFYKNKKFEPDPKIHSRENAFFILNFAFD